MPSFVIPPCLRFHVAGKDDDTVRLINRQLNVWDQHNKTQCNAGCKQSGASQRKGVKGTFYLTEDAAHSRTEVPWQLLALEV